MNYRYRVTLAGIKGFYRVYLVNGDNSLYTFHKQLRSDLEFPMDQPILFKALDAEGSVAARYALMDIGFGAVDNVTIADTVKAGVTSFVYFYDITSKKSVIITLEGETSEKVAADANPIRLTLNRVIPGWTEGLQLVGEGGKIDLFIPAELGYGANGNASIAPNSTLLFNVEVTKVGKVAAVAPVAE